MRPVDKGSVDIPNNWYINSTPGGCLLDFAVQLAECEVPREVTPKFIVILWQEPMAWQGTFCLEGWIKHVGV